MRLIDADELMDKAHLINPSGDLLDLSAYLHIVYCADIKNAPTIKLDTEGSSAVSIPYACPICGGRGIVQGGFYNLRGSTSNATEQCRQCKGIGIIWGVGHEKV